MVYLSFSLYFSSPAFERKTVAAFRVGQSAAVRPPVTRSRWRALPRYLVAVRDAHRLCYAPTRSVGDDDLSSLETRRTLDEDVLDISQMLSRPGHEASEASDAIPRGAESERAGSQANRPARYSQLPGRRVRGEGAAPTVRWCCPRTRSMARLRRLQLSAAVSSVKNGAAICQTGPACSAPPTEGAWTAVARGTGRRADDASRQKSRERATHEA